MIMLCPGVFFKNYFCQSGVNSSFQGFKKRRFVVEEYCSCFIKKDQMSGPQNFKSKEILYLLFVRTLETNFFKKASIF